MTSRGGTAPFLGFLQRTRRLDRGAAAQVTSANVESYVADLASRVRSVTVYNCVYTWTCLVDGIRAQPFTKVWGDGDASSSDGQFFKAGGHGEARVDYTAARSIFA
jgi:TnpA family transposase